MRQVGMKGGKARLTAERPARGGARWAGSGAREGETGSGNGRRPKLVEVRYTARIPRRRGGVEAG